MAEKILSQAEVKDLINHLDRTYSKEVDQVLASVSKDIARFGHVSHETKLKQQALREKMLQEQNKFHSQQKRGLWQKVKSLLNTKSS